STMGRDSCRGRPERTAFPASGWRPCENEPKRSGARSMSTRNQAGARGSSCGCQRSAAGWTLGGEPMRVVIADDHALFRDGLRSLLEARGVEVVAEAANGQDAVELTRLHRPDIVLMDLGMPVLDG